MGRRKRNRNAPPSSRDRNPPRRRRSNRAPREEDNIQTKRQTRAIGVLIGGTLYDPQGGDVCDLRTIRVSQRHLKTGTLRSKRRIGRDMRMWRRDLRLVRKTLFDPIVNLVNVLPPDLQPSASEAESVIAELLRRPALHHVIYWFGHGESPTGDWCFRASERISFERLMGLWVESPARREDSHLVVISDTCYAGAWIPKLQELDMGVVAADERGNVGKVSLQCGCRGGEVSRVDSDMRPISLLLRKMLHPDLLWCIPDQHPTFYQTLRARRHGHGHGHARNSTTTQVAAGLEEERERERVSVVEPGFRFVEVVEDWEVLGDRNWIETRAERVQLVGMDGEVEKDRVIV